MQETERQKIRKINGALRKKEIIKVNDKIEIQKALLRATEDFYQELYKQQQEHSRLNPIKVLNQGS